MPLVYNNRKNRKTNLGDNPKASKKQKKILEDEISSESDFEDDVVRTKESAINEDMFESVEEKTKIAEKNLLNKFGLIEENKEIEVSSTNINVAVKTGSRYKHLADSLKIITEKVFTYRGHRFSPTSVAPSPDGKYLFSCGKDNSVIKYDIINKKKVSTLNKKLTPKFHKHGVNCLAVDPNGKYLATGGAEGIVKLWNLETMEFVSNLAGHRSGITSLAFRLGVDGQLYSASEDRSIRYWDTNQMGFVDIMYGHTSIVGKIDVLHKPRLLSCGTQDQSVRIFKIGEESQLVYTPHVEATSVDTVCYLDSTTFASGAIDGSISIWSSMKKKPICIQKFAHKNGKDNKDCQNWITSLAAIPYSDLMVSGGNNGVINFWKIANDNKKIILITSYSVDGFINDLKFSSNGDFLFCAVGKDHRFGRWSTISEAKNHILVIPLSFGDTNDIENEVE
ncbi:U3 small nucleolar RNA-interacting protein 2 [Strongyloides ratti]|uniref:U3 small nucleolar RNA-interacting protein 2 n=1 Tax=Strongyloides ratti TaxID=34506 RepID=A0A090L197_STRRB|nr:U3 small nucleolar RNA-interacting protein 2 [Strongyloides ratti]CEF63481.1 U3 small nucleolar RNA-interacting protein 2 [Strongyloides ratti]